MSSPTLGAGFAPIGLTAAGLGAPATADAPGAITLGEALKIDTKTRDYVFDDATGDLERMSGTQQRVYLALAALPPLPPVIRSTLAQDVRIVVEQALADLLSEKAIELLAVDASRKTPASRVNIRVRWRDLSDGTEHLNVI